MFPSPPILITQPRHGSNDSLLTEESVAAVSVFYKLIPIAFAVDDLMINGTRPAFRNFSIISLCSNSVAFGAVVKRKVSGKKHQFTLELGL